MKKPRKPRATQATLQLFRGAQDVYVLVTPYDKRGREIPSSVSCAYNTEYFSQNETMAMVSAL